MWSPLKVEIIDRFSAVESFFKATRKRKIEQTVKGLAFVQVYAAYEFAVKSVVQAAVDSISTQKYKIQELKPSLIALFLDAELSSLKDCPKKGIWTARIKIFEKLFSGSSAFVHNTVFPNDGSHFRQSQLQTIFDVFDVSRRPARRRRHLLRIDEVVGNRNDIAHGLITAETAGGRYTRKEVMQMIHQMKSVCLLLLSTVEKQCSEKSRHCEMP